MKEYLALKWTLKGILPFSDEKFTQLNLNKRMTLEVFKNVEIYFKIHIFERPSPIKL